MGLEALHVTYNHVFCDIANYKIFSALEVEYTSSLENILEEDTHMEFKHAF